MKLFFVLLCSGFLVPFAASASSSATTGFYVTDFGAHSDGSNATATTAAFRMLFASQPTGKIIVPAGTYLIDNSSGFFVVSNFSGELRFEGHAQLVFTNNTQGGIQFVGGSGARIYGLRASYLVPAAARLDSHDQVQFAETTDTFLSDVSVQGSPAAGILFWQCIRPKVVNAVVQNSMADGLHFANCQDAQVTNLTTMNTGDDGLAFLNYSIYDNNTGGSAQNIVIRNSKGRGITAVGQSEVTISGFTVENTSSSGILCAYDPTFNTRVPDGVLFSHGIIRNAGTLAPLVGNLFGIEYYYQTSCAFSDIQVSNSGNRAVAGTAPTGQVRVDNIRVKGNMASDGFSFDQTAAVEVSNSTAEAIQGYGFIFHQCQRVTAKDLTAINTSQSSTLHRAIWFEDNQNVAASNLNVVDMQPVASGYILGAYQAQGIVQNGSVKGIQPAVTNGAFSIQNNCPNLQIVN